MATTLTIEERLDLLEKRIGFLVVKPKKKNAPKKTRAPKQSLIKNHFKVKSKKST